jgi:hypothetical protein
MLDMLATRTPTERLKMVSQMFHAGKTLVLAGIQAQYPESTPGEIQAELFRRLYRSELSDDMLARICTHLLQHPR